MGNCDSRVLCSDRDIPEEKDSFNRLSQTLGDRRYSTGSARTYHFDLESFYPGTHSIERMVMHAKSSWQMLGLKALTDEQLEKVAVLVYDSMSAPTRTFHTSDHIFDLSKYADPLQHIAIAFHDIIYYQIDGGLSDAQREYLDDVIIEEGETIKITTEKLETVMEMVMDIFGYTYGQTLDPYKGMNEFLSASVCVRALVEADGGANPSSRFTPILVQCSACIEATIPFRKPDEQGRNPPEALFDRLKKVNETYKVGWDEHKIVKAVQRAADLGNRDLSSFSWTDREKFLSCTWKLLPESNVAMRHDSYYLNDLALALSKMANFFENLDPETLYFSFQDDATEKINVKKRAEAKINVDTALTYMRCNLVAMSVISAVAMLSGGDAPRSLFMGDLQKRRLTSTRPLGRNMEDLLDMKYEPAADLKLNQFVLKLLIEGRHEKTIFDTRNAPVASFLYSHLGDLGLKKSLSFIQLPMNQTTSMQLLKSLPLNPAVEILAACANIAVTRKKKIVNIVEKLDEKMANKLRFESERSL